MPASQQEPKFTEQEAQRFASLMAGGDTPNPFEAEAVGKLRVLRRMAAAKGLRLMDVFELPEIRKAIDEQLQPVRAANTDAAAIAEIEELRGKLAVVVPKLREVTEALTREKQLTAKLRGQSQPAQRRQGRSAPAPRGRYWFIEILCFVGALVLEILDTFERVFK
jgi:hypothetical protein